MKTLGLYLHIPFCVQKCHYCDFLSAPTTEQGKQRYANALLQQIRQTSQRYSEYEVDTVFLGGGTPSVMPVNLLADIMQAVHTFFRVTEQAEVTMECNPGTLTYGMLAALKEMGINRLSLGLQSTENEDLKRLGRIHSYEMFLQTYQDAREAGFDNINIDVMTSLPGQTKEKFRECLKKVASLQPEHLSVYSLIIEEGTLFYRWYEEEHRKDLPPLPSEEEDRAMYHDTLEILQCYGYHRYEISNYAKAGRESRHNKKYWDRSEYLGLGLGASSMIANKRWHNTQNLEAYLQGDASPCEEEILSEEACMSEFMFLGLRMMKGVSKEQFAKTFHRELEEQYGTIIRKHIKEGLLAEKNGYLYLTERGIDVSNYVMADFL